MYLEIHDQWLAEKGIHNKTEESNLKAAQFEGSLKGHLFRQLIYLLYFYFYV